MNIGAQWPTPQEAEATVLRMQTKLHRWAGEDHDRQFDDLYNLVCDPAFLAAGWHRVRSNRGARSAGVDGISARDIERQGVEAFLGDLREELRRREFRPLPVRERMIPKANGKMRRLGIPTVRDRVVQAALKMVLEPIFESDFQPFSYGFRPNRRAQDAIAARLAQVGLELNWDKTRIVYCKDADRTGSYEHIKFTFLGYEFRPRLAKSKHGKHFVSFLPAVSQEAMKAMGREIRSWHMARRSDRSLDDLARMFNSIVQGWINYYGRFYRSRLLYFLRRLNQHLMRWACRKYHQRLRNRERRAMAWLAEIAGRSPNLFAHWRLGARPDGWAMGAG